MVPTHELELREHTMRNYLLRIYDKLGISSRVELILYAVNSTEARRRRQILEHIRLRHNDFLNPRAVEKKAEPAETGSAFDCSSIFLVL